MPRVVLTKTFVESVAESDWYWDTKLPGFCLRIQKGRKKVYVVCRKIKGSQRNTTVTIGDHSVLSTEQARTEAKQILAQMAQGINPNEQRRKVREIEESKRREQRGKDLAQAITLRQALDDYLCLRDLKDSTRYVYKISIEFYLKDWLNLSLVDITKDMVEKRHQKLSEFKAQANHSMRVLRAIFAYAMVAYEDAYGKPIITDNPVRRLSQIRAWHRIPRRQTVVKSHQLSQWYSAVSDLPNDVVRDYLLLVLLTGLRKSEAASLTWKNVDMKGLTLTVLDTKNRQDHMLPLSNYLYHLLLRRWQSRENEYVFPSASGKGYLKDCDALLEQVSEQCGVTFTLHDLRRTFLTTAEKIDIPYYALKRLANHKLNADITSGYIVSDVERLRAPMQAITDELLSNCGLRHGVRRKVVNQTRMRKATKR